MITRRRPALSLALVLASVAACSKPATSPAVTTQATGTAVTPAVAQANPAATAPPLAPVDAGTATAPAASAPATTAQTGEAAPPPLSNGYSCSFPGPTGRSVLARFTLDGAGAHDDQGLPFTVLTNSPTALVLAHARDDLATSANGDVGAYVVAIDRRTLGMVETTVGLDRSGVTRRGHCIAG